MKVNKSKYQEAKTRKKNSLVNQAFTGEKSNLFWFRFFIKRVKRSVALNQFIALNQLLSRSKFTRVEQYNSISNMKAAVMEVTYPAVKTRS